MNEANRISDDNKWQAVIRCDKNFDGVFFYGVKTTGIFCNPSCKSKKPVRDNIDFFADSVEAMQHGFRPCKRCCPDRAGFEPELDIVKAAEALIAAGYHQHLDISSVSQQLGVSRNHLIRLFKRYRRLTPAQYIAKIRVGKATELLKQEELSVLGIAYAVGFKSLSNFYKCYKEITGHTPNANRKRGGDG